MISASFEDLAQALRVLLEANWRAHTDGMSLLLADRPEAVGNIDAGLNAVVNSFHSVYDAMGKELNVQAVDWYATPELAIILAIRNARHHNKANKIRHLYNYHVQTAPHPSDHGRYVVIDFPARESGADTFDVHVSWADLSEYLSMPKKESRLPPSVSSSIQSYLNSSKFAEYTKSRDLPETAAFINVVPLIVNAASVIVPHIRPHIRSASTEAEYFAIHFSDMEPANMQDHEVDEITIFFPN